MTDTVMPKVGKYLFRSEPFHCDFSKHLLMAHLGNHLLNAADFHSRDRGFGVSYLNTIQRTWVLSRLAVEMFEMPQIYDEFYVETWCEKAIHYFTSRNFAITRKDGALLGYGKSIWAMINTQTRQPADIFAVKDGLIQSFVETGKPCPIDKPSRVTVGDDAPLVRSVATYYNDVDLNGHINSMKYVEHLLDLFDMSWYSTHRLKRFDIAYVAESHQGDELRFYSHEAAEGVFSIKVMKKSPGSEDELEACRCQLIFEKI